MSVRFLKTVRASEVQPNAVLEVFGVYYRVRKLNYHGGQVTIFLQDEKEPLSYFVKNDIINVTVPREIEIDIEVHP